MPPTNDQRQPVAVLIDGLASFDLVDHGSLLGQAARAALAAQSRTEAAGAEISLAFVDDTRIADLNARWLGHAGPTDVLSFGLDGEPLVADVYISVETAARNARGAGVAIREELVRLVVHGVLHAAGFDHPEGDDRVESEMFALQERVVRRLLEDRPET